MNKKRHKRQLISLYLLIVIPDLYACEPIIPPTL